MALFLAFGMEQDVFFAGFFVVSGVTAASSLAHTRDRINLLRAGLQTGLIGAAVALLIEFYRIQTDPVGLMILPNPCGMFSFVFWAASALHFWRLDYFLCLKDWFRD